MLMRTDPFRNWDRMFEATASSGSSAAMDAYRVGDVVTVEFDLPGVDEDSLDVQVERGELRLTAQRRRSTPEGASYLVQERRDTKVSRRVMLGETLDVDHVDAEYTDGVLTLRIPLRESAKPRQVAVRRSADQPALDVETV
ncbi:MAG: Hsp20/alpha crystallin family protein [Microthrixaceae bacterium]